MWHPFLKKELKYDGPMGTCCIAENYIQSSVIIYVGKESEREWMCESLGCKAEIIITFWSNYNKIFKKWKKKVQI